MKNAFNPVTTETMAAQFAAVNNQTVYLEHAGHCVSVTNDLGQLAGLKVETRINRMLVLSSAAVEWNDAFDIVRGAALGEPGHLMKSSAKGCKDGKYAEVMKSKDGYCVHLWTFDGVTASDPESTYDLSWSGAFTRFADYLN